MENLTRIIDAAIASNDAIAIQSVFRGNINTTNNNQQQSSSSSTGSWLSIGQGEQRSLAAYFIVAAVKNETFLESSMNALFDTYSKVLHHLPATVENAADNKLRNVLFQFMVSEQEDYAGAAKILSSMRMMNNSNNSSSNDDPDGVYQMTPAEKTDVYVKIAECYLAIDEIVESDSAVQKAGVCVEQIANKEQHMALILRYKSTYARILDANRKFISAATRYHELSQSSTEVCQKYTLETNNVCMTCSECPLINLSQLSIRYFPTGDRCG